MTTSMALQGKKVTLACHMKDEGVNACMWTPLPSPEGTTHEKKKEIFRNGAKSIHLDLRYNVSYNFQNQTFRLVIDPVELNDAGEFCCSNDYCRGEQSCTHLIVHTEPKTSELSNEQVVCQTFQYRGIADIRVRWIVGGYETSSNSTTEIQRRDDLIQITSCFDATNHTNADIDFQLYMCDKNGTWESPRYSARKRSQASTATPVSLAFWRVLLAACGLVMALWLARGLA